MNIEKSEHTFFSSGTRCAGTLYLPTAEKMQAVVVLAHGLGAIRSLGLLAKAEAFAKKGIAAFAFDYRSFGDSDGDSRNHVDIRGQIKDWQAAINYVSELPEIDRNRVILSGTSLSGGHVLSVAAGNHQIKAVLCTVPHLDGLASAFMVKPGFQVQAVFRGVADLLRHFVFSKAVYSPVFAPDHEFSAEPAPGNWEMWQKVQSQFSGHWDNQIRSVFFLELPFYSPIRKLDKVRARILMIGASQDSITPISQVRKAAKRNSLCTLRELDCDHLELFMGGHAQEEFALQLDFITEVLAEEAHL